MKSNFQNNLILKVKIEKKKLNKKNIELLEGEIKKKILS
jgi:hypothetical protein